MARVHHVTKLRGQAENSRTDIHEDQRTVLSSSPKTSVHASRVEELIFPETDEPKPEVVDSTVMRKWK